MDKHDDEPPRARKRSRAPKKLLNVSDLQGFKFFKRLQGLLDVLRPCAAHQNRLLHFDEYAAAVIFYFFNPTIPSLRGLQRATEFQKVQKVLGLRRMSLGSMSESVRVFDPDLLAQVFEGLAEEAPLEKPDPRLKDIQRVLTAVDGTILRALPRMTWALWLRDAHRGAKAHVQFEVLKDSAVHVELTPGRTSEVQRLKANLKAGRLYIMDRGYRDFDLLQAIVDADSSFVIRLHQNALYETLEQKELTEEALEAHVRADRIVRLGCDASREKFDRAVRLVEVHVPEQPPRTLGYRPKRVCSKKTFRQARGKPYRMLIATDCTDLPADVIALVYRHRWKVELFFRVLKSVFGCRHLLSDSIQGVTIQLYCALIAALLLAEYTGLRPNKRTYELLALYLQGWVTNEELVRELAKMKRQAAPKKS